MADLKGECPICDGQVKVAADTEESEIITCPECESRLVVVEIKKSTVVLEEAPEIEEDWGE